MQIEVGCHRRCCSMVGAAFATTDWRRSDGRDGSRDVYVAQTSKCCSPCDRLTFVRQKTSQRRQTAVCATRKRRRDVKSAFVWSQKRQSVAAMQEIDVCATCFCNRNVKVAFVRQQDELQTPQNRQIAVSATRCGRSGSLFCSRNVKSSFLRRCRVGETSPVWRTYVKMTFLRRCRVGEAGQSGA